MVGWLLLAQNWSLLNASLSVVRRCKILSKDEIFYTKLREIRVKDDVCVCVCESLIIIIERHRKSLRPLQ